jgi:hypothetical protein
VALIDDQAKQLLRAVLDDLEAGRTFVTELHQVDDAEVLGLSMKWKLNADAPASSAPAAAPPGVLLAAGDACGSSACSGRLVDASGSLMCARCGWKP